MEQKKIPELLFVTRSSENKVRGYKFIQALSNNKYLYQELENGYKECFFYTDIFMNDTYLRGYSNSTYKEQDRNKRVRIKRRGENKI